MVIMNASIGYVDVRIVDVIAPTVEDLTRKSEMSLGNPPVYDMTAALPRKDCGMT